MSASTLPQAMLEAFRNQPSAVAVAAKRDAAWVTLDRQTLARRIRDLALGLEFLGVRHGEPVVLWSESRPEWILADLAIQAVGAVTVPIYPQEAAARAAAIFQITEARFAFAGSPVLMDRLLEVHTGGVPLGRIIPFDPIEGPGGEVPIDGLREVEAQGRAVAETNPGRFDALLLGTRPHDLATILFTSGTTGEPKGVMLAHSNLLSNAIDAAAGRGGYFPNDRSLSLLPLSHIFERTVTNACLLHGVPVYFAQRMDTVAQDLRDVQPTTMAAVPRLFEKMLQKMHEAAAAQGGFRARLVRWALEVARTYGLARFSRAENPHPGKVPFPLRMKQWAADRLVLRHLRAIFGGRLRDALCGGAPLSEDLAAVFWASGVPILLGYGLTETSPVVSVNSAAANRLGTAGKLISHVDVRLAADGEILVRGPGVMKGYFRKPAETGACFEGAWFKTGDVGRLDEDGYLIITDRKRDLIKTSGGKFLSPVALESRLLTSRFIAQAMVIGEGRRFPAVLIVPNFALLESHARRKGIPFNSREELVASARLNAIFLRQVQRLTRNFSHPERPKAVALLPEEFSTESGSLTVTQKVRRSVVEARYARLLDKIYAERGA